METIIGTDINLAQQFLEQGNVIGIPTETVYGLAGNALNEEAVLKIFSVKNRPYFDPLIVHTHSLDEVIKYTQQVPQRALDLMEAFMPGPLTVLLPRQSCIPDLVTSGLETVAVRIPNHPLTLSLLQQLAFPLAAPSANPFGYISPTTSYHVYDQLHGRIPYILEGGATEIGVESTIVGFENNQAVVYRLGGLAIEEIERVVGKVLVQTNTSSDPKSPGMLKSHYAPRKRLVLTDAFDITDDELSRVGVIAWDKKVVGVPDHHQIVLSEKGSLKEAAKHLFAAMRTLDETDVDYIIAVRVPDVGLGRAINDRLKRAAA
jgi:L-threonylcarbamoyladenylate synthase